jgi:FAD/FMN-containing dehydrogenase
MTRERNWADNYAFLAARIHRPASVDELRRVVARASRIRAIGTRHSFNGIADSPGDLVDLSGINPDFVIGPERRLVTVGAATNYGVLSSHLHQLGHTRPLVRTAAAFPGLAPNSGPPAICRSEYMVPRARAEAIARLRAIGDWIDPHLWATEIRSMAGNKLWRSPAYGDDCIAIHFSWLREFDAVQAMTEEIEAMLLPLGARLHWGKIIHSRAEQLAPLYPKLAAFRELVRSYDPGEKFRNEFLRRHVFG